VWWQPNRSPIEALTSLAFLKHCPQPIAGGDDLSFAALFGERSESEQTVDN
jgi:hypothetical protein